MFHFDADLRQGLIFGTHSGIITTAGILSGIIQAKVSPLIIIVTIVSLAISDGLSEAYGLFISKKVEEPKDKSVGPAKSFLGLLFTKVLVVLSFLIPFLFSRKLTYFKNMSWPILWSILVLTIIDYYSSKLRKEKLAPYLVQHYLLLAVTIGLNIFFGKIIAGL
jgi:vacuolar iron transporter family protein